jgi:hypothetical protein
MKRHLQNNKGVYIFILLLIPELLGSCSKSIESPQITSFLDELPVRIVGMTFDSNGDMYVGTIENLAQKRILRITHDGKISTFISIECFAIEYLKTGKNDTVYASIITNNIEGGAQIVKIPQDGTSSLFSDGFTQPVGITFDLKDNMYVVDAMTKKVYKITPSKEKSVFIDLGMNPEVPDNFYHGIDFDDEYRSLYIAGLNTGNMGNLLKYPINAEGEPGEPIIISDHYSKHVVVHNNVVYSTIDVSSLLIINEDGTQKVINNPLLNEGMNLSFGQKEFGDNTLYINTFNKIVKVSW